MIRPTAEYSPWVASPGTWTTARPVDTSPEVTRRDTVTVAPPPGGVTRTDTVSPARNAPVSVSATPSAFSVALIRGPSLDSIVGASGKIVSTMTTTGVGAETLPAASVMVTHSV